MRTRGADRQTQAEVRQRFQGVWPQAAPADPVPGPPPDPLVDPGPDSDVVPALAGGRAALGAFDPGRRGLRALLVVAAVVAVVAGYLFWHGQPRVEPAPTLAVPGGTGSPGGPVGTIVVAVAGRVAHPGLVRLPDGARVQDAIEAAGGVLPGTDVSFLNLARKLVDGELLVIGVSPPPAAGNGAAGPGAAGTGKVDLNTATLAELDTLPGIGPALAQRILDYRAAHGSFRAVDELRKVEGIGDAKYAEIKDRVTV